MALVHFGVDRSRPPTRSIGRHTPGLLIEITPSRIITQAHRFNTKALSPSNLSVNLSRRHGNANHQQEAKKKKKKRLSRQARDRYSPSTWPFHYISSTNNNRFTSSHLRATNLHFPDFFFKK
jgi:hypothetical protein